ncbi:MAG: tetratricopeptide repeat protein [Candidatus Omnitrophica bacterium]|nr:tetratricopeptide repeat protein [Candidatus Omnitrophota bacterium]
MSNPKLKLFVVFSLLTVFIAGYGICAQGPSQEEEAYFVAAKAFDDGFYEVSLDLFSRFLKNYPASSRRPQAELLIGRCYFQQNKFLDALNKFESLLNQPLSAQIKDALLYWTAEVNFKGNNFEKAADFYKRVIDEFPGSSYGAASFYSLGWCLFEEGKFREALKYFQTVEEKYLSQFQAQDVSFKIIECLYNLKDYPAIKERVKTYLKAYSKDTLRLSYLYFYSGEAEYYSDKFNEAIDAYSKALQNNGDDKIKALSRLGIGWSYLKLKQYKEATQAFIEVDLQGLDKKGRDVLLLGKAIVYFETGKLREARDAYIELLKMTSEPVILMQAYLGEADALYSLAEYAKAIEVYKEAIGKDTGNTPADIMGKLRYNLAWSYLKQGEFRDAIQEFQKIVKTSDDKIVKVSALCQIGDTYQDSGDYKLAKEAYDAILKDYPDSSYSDYVQYQLGLTMLKSSNYAGAAMSFLALKRDYPDSKLADDATYALGLAYFQKQDYVSSQETFQKFKDEYKESSLRPQALYLLGSSLYNLGRFPEAIEAYKDIVRIYNQDLELVQKAEYEIADCFYQIGNEKEAMGRFKALRSRYPDSTLSPEVIWWLGEYYYRHNDLELARRYFSSLIQDFPRSNLVVDALYAIGSTYAGESRYDEAIANFQKVIDSGKSDLYGQATVAIADIYVKLNKTDLALRGYRDIINEHPELEHLIYPKIAELLFKMGDLNQALETYRRSLDLVPVGEMADIQFKIAEILQAQGKPQEAIEEYLKVTYLYSENSELAVKALLRVAKSYEDKEDFKGAVNIYKKIITLDTQEAKYAQERMDWIKANIK